jgi:hypothetical protein
LLKAGCRQLPARDETVVSDNLFVDPLAVGVSVLSVGHDVSRRTADDARLDEHPRPMADTAVGLPESWNARKTSALRGFSSSTRSNMSAAMTATPFPSECPPLSPLL